MNMADIHGNPGNPASLRQAFEPAYLALHRSGELRRRAGALWAMMGECRLCPRECGVNRLQGERGFCRAPGTRLVISSYGAHFGEERPLVGLNGSGTIFFSHCSLRCSFCQNWEISISGEGMEQSIGELAGLMLCLQDSGCHNINLVTPTHYSAHILDALDIAAARGLRLPLVYNTCGWERLEILGMLDGVVDIYMPDFKYWEADMASKYSAGAASYPELTAKAILEMQRQTGTAQYAGGGIMQRGLIIRHLVLPNNVGGSEMIMEWIAQNLPADTYVNIMAQYHPEYKAQEHPELSRTVTSGEYAAVVEKAKKLGLVNLDIQGRRLL
ncbi:MAG: radical SAM protein [Desulfomicrobium apsheronum]|nr:radical SAM protein [Desulfomicrobium apsheronum]